MPIIRKKLAPDELYPTDIRYDPETDTVQRLIDGEWVDAPESDPRTHTTLPPRITSDPNCDAAQSVVDALHGQIDSILEAIDNSQTAFTIAGLILGLFVFGVFDIFIALALALANAMLDAGEGALSDALTEPVYEQLKCILYCEMNGSGQLNPGSLATINTNIADQIGGLAGAVFSGMLNLAGEGGINNLAAQGTSTGDCSGCTNCNCQTIVLALNSGASPETDFDTEIGQTYSVRYSGKGVVGHDSGGDYTGDAFYYEYPTGADNWTAYGGSNGMNVPDGGSVPAFQNSHVYIFSGIAGTGSPFAFHFTDPSYVENSGELKIKTCKE
jgi:hypothetical protein